MTKVRDILPKSKKETGSARALRPFTHSMEEFFENSFPRRWMEGLFEPYVWSRPFWNESEEMFELPTRVDMLDKGDMLLIRAEMPGIKKEDLEITVSGDRLILEAKRSFEEEVKEDDFIRREMGHGRLFRTLDFRFGYDFGAWRLEGEMMYRTLRLPVEVYGDKAVAELHDGMLELRLPKVEVTTPIKVEVA